MADLGSLVMDFVKGAARDVVAPVQRNIVQPALQTADNAYNTGLNTVAKVPVIGKPLANADRGFVNFAASIPKVLGGIGNTSLQDALHGNNNLATQNAMAARNRAETTFGGYTLRPLTQAAESIVHPFSQHTYTPTPGNAQRLLGKAPIQNINKGVNSTYQHGRAEGESPLVAGLRGGLYGFGQAAQDVGTVAGLKYGVTGASSAAKASLSKLTPLDENGYLQIPGGDELSPADYRVAVKQKLGDAMNDHNAQPKNYGSTGNGKTSSMTATYQQNSKLFKEYAKNPDAFIDKYNLLPPAQKAAEAGVVKPTILSTSEATPVKAPLPSPTEMPPTTPVSDVNTPQQVAQQGSAAEAAYNPNQTELGAVGKDVTEPTPEQSSLDQTAPPDFMNAPGEAPTPNHVSKVGTMSEMGEILNQGGTTEEALSHYMTQVPGATLGDAQDALDQTIKSAGVDKSKINASENPQTGKVSFAPVKEGDDTGAQLNGRYAGEKVGQNGAPAYRAMEALDATDRESTRFLRGKSDAQVQTLIDNAHNPKAFRDYVNASKNYNDYAQASGAELGQPLPYRVNYGGRTAYDPPEGLPEGGKPGATNPNTPSYTQQRYFNTHEEALANGYTPRYDDPLEELKNDINQRGYNQTQLALAKGYEDAHPGQVQLLNDTTPIKAGYHQLVVPGGEHIALPKELADPINTRIMTSTPGKILGKYDTINAAGKQLELGGGTFHGFNTLGTFVGQQLASAKAFTDLGATAKVVANTLSDKNMVKYEEGYNKELPELGNHSWNDVFSAIGLNAKNTSSDLVNPGEKNLAGKIANLPVLKQIHDAVFTRQIPTMMKETARQKIQGANLDIFGSGDDRLAAEKIARGINKEFGVTDHDLAGMTSQQFKSAGRFLLAPGYQEGVIHTLLTALDPRSIGTSEGLLARQAVIGKALVMGGLATAGAVAGGDFNGMTPKQVALGIMNKAINPSFKIGGYKVSTPATFISDVAKPIEESVAGAKAGHGIAAGPEDFASSHLAFLPSKAEEFWANKNYAGNAVYGKDYYGRPISGATTAENVASGVLPIPLAQTSQAVAGNQSTSAAIANTLGFNVSDETANNINYAPVAAQTYLQQLQATPGVSKEAIQSATKFVAALGAGDTGRSKVLTKATSLLAQAEKSTNQSVVAKDEAQVQTLITNYNKQLATALQPWIQSDASTYTDNNMLKLLRDTMITNKNARSNVNYDIKTNPTSVGVPIAALAPTPTTQSNNLVPNSI